MFYLLLLINLISSSAFATIQIESLQNKAVASPSLNYAFKLIDDKTSKEITSADLVETHTQVLHLVVYDASLNQFNHVHPQFDGNSWVVDLNLTVNGTYKVWAQGMTTTGKEFSVARPLAIENGADEIPVVALGDGRTGIDGVTQIELDSTTLKAGKMAMIDFTVSRTDGTTPDLTPYLGAFAHVIATQLQGDELIHVHPMEGADANSGMLHATFPRAGDYRLWIQLIDGGVLRTVPLSVVVY